MSDELFPPALCAQTLGELAAWSSVPDILAAARILEGRATPEDQPAATLVMPLAHEDPAFEQIFVILLRFLSQGYALPVPKIALCRSLDPLVTDDTAARLEALRFRPEVRSVRTRNPPHSKALVIADEPAVIELVRAPLNCLMGLMLDKYETAMQLRSIMAQAREKTGAAPTIFHRPYADARLPALIEAACFYSLGLDVGLRFAKDGSGHPDNGCHAEEVPHGSR